MTVDSPVTEDLLAADFLNSKNAWAVGNNGTIIKYGKISTTVDEINDVPSSYLLSQNYPNPFNPVTNISYHNPEAGKVNITVFDILGRRIKTLIDEYVSPGKYELQFDAGELSSGVYIYRITAGKFSASKKFVLMK
ncbi:MAG: T9SS type A sorting domain-containing protein [Melioribacteraceae bacterium]|nr:T9SS type A sorting domain-containing protein [Melioribacteraceae bacterium]MCF8354757.1 T9SS type A sorting domain-containing protein [Melioribacteraceae bacterium]MCF8394382.1 T9SS type A sorting domain-containing protein [Melioribacteraceae bacterium]MCF8417522.1 T9SS type A sorting domain-containing protein [Melioribacteraceae bacterium]